MDPARATPQAQTRCPSCERRAALSKLKRALRDGALDGRSALLLSSAAVELERDASLNARAVLALTAALL